MTTENRVHGTRLAAGNHGDNLGFFYFTFSLFLYAKLPIFIHDRRRRRHRRPLQQQRRRQRQWTADDELRRKSNVVAWRKCWWACVCTGRTPNNPNTCKRVQVHQLLSRRLYRNEYILTNFLLPLHFTHSAAVQCNVGRKLTWMKT